MGLRDFEWNHHEDDVETPTLTDGERQVLEELGEQPAFTQQS
jgi:hypothetical protein